MCAGTALEASAGSIGDAVNQSEATGSYSRSSRPGNYRDDRDYYNDRNGYNYSPRRSDYTDYDRTYSNSYDRSYSNYDRRHSSSSSSGSIGSAVEQSYRQAPNYSNSRPWGPRNYHSYSSYNGRNRTSRTYYPQCNSVLGISFGSQYDYCYRSLSRSYSIYQYNTSTILVENATLYGYTWPETYLSFSNGRLQNAQYVYYTDYNLDSRYDAIYNTLYRSYGRPDVSNQYSTVWYTDSCNGYISLDYRTERVGSRTYYVTCITVDDY